MTVQLLRRPRARTFLSVALALVLAFSVLAAPAHADPSTTCADAVPIGDVTAGLTGTGYTVSQGTAPDPFTAEVIGKINDGIAPGIDMIIADLDSPAIREAGVWFGMSGSPVYTDDGRLIGAVAYSLSFEQSSIAGLTPAEQMTKLYRYGTDNGATALADDVQMSSNLQARVVRQTDATSKEVAQGLSMIPVPVGVSGLSQRRLSKLEKRLEGKVELALSTSAAAKAAPGSASDIFPGSNIVAALSYGDLTVAGAGTTTDVCDGKALAFGHPFFWSGRTEMSAHPAEAVYVQPDGGFSFKVVNPGGVVGTVDQDRLTGIRATFGDGPDGTDVTSTVRSLTTGEERSGQTVVNVDDDVPDLAPFHLLVNLDRILDKIGDGRTGLTWTASGTDGDGQAWTVTRRNRFASRNDVSFETVVEMLDWLYAIEQADPNVTYDSVTMDATADETFERLLIGKVSVRVNNGKWRNITKVDQLRPRPGDTIKARIQLRKVTENGTYRTLYRRMTVPRRLSGKSLRLAVLGGENIQYENNIFGATTLPDVLDRMDRTASNNHVVTRLQRGGGNAGPRVAKKDVVRLGNTVRGQKSVSVRVR